MAGIDTLAVPPGADVWYSDDFRNVLEDHMTLLRSNVGQYVRVEEFDLIKYQFDLYGLYRQYQVAEEHLWPTMRLNGLSDPTNVPQDLQGFYTPNIQLLSQILNHYNTGNRTNR